MSFITDNLVSEGLADIGYLRSQTTSQANANSTLTLANVSTRFQVFTGSVVGQIVKMPDATTLTVGYEYWILNESSVNVTVQDNSGGSLLLLGAGQRGFFICIGVGSAAGTWSYSLLDKTSQGEQFRITYPGTGLAVNYTSGNYRQNGVLTAVASGAITLPASTTGTIYVDIDGTVKATASIPNGATPLYNFVTSGSAVTTLTDAREDLENNIVWGVLSDITAWVSGQAKAAGTSEKYARADHAHGNSEVLKKSGTVAFGSFSGSPKKATVTFGTAFGSTAYAIELVGIDNRNWTYESKAAGSFVINANANAALTGEVSWTAIATGETT